MKVIFLDIDGVLNSEHCFKKDSKRYRIHPKYMRNLRRIVKKTGAKIVLTSVMRGSIRKNSFHYVHQIFNDYGLSIYDYTSKGESAIRGYEIQDWLDKHRDVTNIVIIDDDVDMVHLSKYLVRTLSWPYIKMKDGSMVRNKSPFAWMTEGLNYKASNKAIAMLKKSYINIYAMKNNSICRKTF
jgi:hypothetical protein